MSKQVWVLLTSVGLWMLLIVACLAFKLNDPAVKRLDGQIGSLSVQSALRAPSIPELVITETVGTESAQCGAKSALVIAPETTVYFCLMIFNSGNITFTSAKIKQENSVSSPLVGSIPFVLAPGESLAITSGMVTTISGTNALLKLNNLKTDVINTLTFTAEVNSASAIAKSTNATVSIANATAKINKTVGLTPNTCASTSSLFIIAGAKVYYCLTIQNTGNVVLSNHHISDTLLNLSNSNDYSAIPALQPGATYSITNAQLPALAYQTTGNNAFVNTVAYNADGPFGPATEAKGQATVRVGAVSLAITQTVGTDPQKCAATSVTAIKYGSTIYYCLIIKNAGDFPFNQFTIDAPARGINKQSFTHELAAGGILELAYATVNRYLANAAAGFTIGNVTAPLTNTISVAATTTDGRTESKTATAATYVGNAAIGVTKYVETDPSACLPNLSLTVNPGALVYYCLRVENRGEVTLTDHRIYEPTTGVNSTFSYPLAPGAVLSVTNTALGSTLKATALMGPFTINASVNNTLYFTSTNNQGFLTGASTGADINLPTPTRTATPVRTPTLTLTPGPTSTFTPLPTATPSPTPIPSATGTATPVAVSLLPAPTSTHDFRVSSVTTPPAANTGQQPNSPIQQPNSPVPQPVSPLPPPDANAQAAAETAQAATATALALLATPPMPTATPLPPTQVITSPALITTTVAPTALADQRPIEFPTPTPPTNFMALFGRVANMSITAAGWIWFLCGSLIFFVTAGVLVGVGFRRQEQRRYTMVEQNAPLNRSERTSSAPRTATEPAPEDEDNWPTSLP
ncbi:MAG: hypothetical protein U0350_26270 [Caldilineaceae bacterium]